MKINIDLTNKILIVLYLLVFTVSENQTMDRLAPQVMVLSILNSLSIIYLYLSNQFFRKINGFKKLIEIPHFQVIFLIVLILISIPFSFLFSFNIAESIITANNIFQFFLTFINLILLLKNVKKIQSFSLNLVLILLLLESLLVFYQIIDYYLTYDVIGRFGRTFEIRGFTGNINITAFSIVYKIPFLIYFIDKQTNLFKVVFSSLILFISSIDIFHLNSRGAILSLIIIITSYPIFIFIEKRQKYKLFIIIFIIFSATYTTNYFAGTDRVNERVKTISVSTEDGSVDQRFRFYNQIKNYFLENPFKPLGVGMYKLKSIEFDKENISKYIVPGHAHNDFLEILIELGVIAFLSFLFIFVLLFRLAFNNFFRKNRTIFYPIGLFLIIYFLDSNLNFPITRPISFIFFCFISSLTINLDESSK